MIISDYPPIITSTNKMAASCSRAFDEMKFFLVVQCFFFNSVEIITCVFILKQRVQNAAAHIALELTVINSVI